MELCYACLRALSSLSEASGTAQIHRDWGVIEVSRGVGGVISLEAVSVVPLLSLFWDKSAHLVIIPLPEDLVYGFLGNDAINGPLFEYLVVVAGRRFEDVSSHARD